MPRYKGPPPIADPDTFGPGTVLDIYLRASPGRKQEKSVHEQLAEIRLFFAQHKWTIGETFCDDNRSGADAGRKDLNRLLTRYREGRFAPARGLVIWSYSRMSREGSISFEILAVTRAAGVPLVAVVDKVPHELRDFMEPFYFMSAQQQLQKIREDTARGMHAMMAENYAPGGFPPRGYKVEYEQHGVHRDGSPCLWPRWVKDPDLQVATKRAWEMKLEGSSLPAIIATTHLFTSRGSLVTFFRNPAYCGFPVWYLHYRRLSVLDCLHNAPVVEPYVTVSQWLAVQDMAGNHSGDPRREFGGWPLSGMVTCGYCGGAVMVMAYSDTRHCDVCGRRWSWATPTCRHCGADYTHRDGMYRYICGTHHRQKERCLQSRYLNGRTLDLILLKELVQRFTAEAMAEQAEEINRSLLAMEEEAACERRELEEKLQRSQEASANLLKAVERGNATDLLLGRMGDLERETLELRSRLAVLPLPGAVARIAPDQVEEVATLFRKKLFTLRRFDLRQLFLSLGMKVTLWNEKAEASVDWPPLSLFLPLYVVQLCQYPQRGRLMMLCDITDQKEAA
ncbi:MAG: recombinase family protein [Phycisphaerae bacterium]|jgi:DNA invertase Pin-like site-specific DNA recombinase